MDDCQTEGKRLSWLGMVAISLATLLALWLGSVAMDSSPVVPTSLRDGAGSHRVTGHSMEPTLRGSRWPAVCTRCDAPRRVFESRGASPVWLCPHCGEPLQASGLGGAEGDLVTVKPLGPADRVERDDLVVFRDAARGQWHVKRVVGLPGERLSIDRGDFAIDGQVIRKSVWRFLESSTLLAVWQPEAPASDRWHAVDGPEAYLSYRHWSPWPRNSAGYPLQPASVTDEEWRDADQSWSMVAVDDIGLVLELSDLSAGFTMEVEGYHSVGRWRVQLHRIESGAWRIAVGPSGSHPMQPSVGTELEDGSSSSVRIVVAHVDSAVRVGIEGGGEHGWLWPLPSLSQALVAEESQGESAVSTTQPLRIRWSKGAGRLTKARVVRDVHYRGPHGEATWEALVPPAHLYLLGDHPSGSLDSRQQGPLPLASKSLLGRVEALGSWSERLELQESDLGARKTDVFP